MRRGRPVVNVHGNYRTGVHPGRDRKNFSRTAGMTNAVNTRAVPMRGGYRL